MFFFFPSNTVKRLSLTINCSAGTMPDLVKAIYAHLAKFPISNLLLQDQTVFAG